MKHYIYLNRRNDTGEVFYVGAATQPSGYTYCKPGYRATQIHKSQSSWMDVYNAAGFTGEIVAYCETKEQRDLLEIALIKLYGRKDLGEGNLVNQTNGGAGSKGIKRKILPMTRYQKKPKYK